MKQEDKKHELDFWRGFVKTDRFLKGWCSDEKTPELRQEVYDFIKARLDIYSRVADVGSGVVSILHGTVPQNNLLTLDPLADDYAQIFNYKSHGIKKGHAYTAEEIPHTNAYDVVHSSNAIDHTQDIKKAFESMLGATKEGGHLIIQCFENEGTHEKWAGFHQHDVYLGSDKNLYCRKKNDMEILVSEGTGFEIVHAELTNLLGRNWIVWIAKKS